MTSLLAKRADKQDPYCADQGIPFLIAAGRSGMGRQDKRLTQVGASPFAVSFADQGLMDMADGNYRVTAYSDATGAVVGTTGTKTTSGFVFTGGADATAYHFEIVGTLKDQAAEVVGL